MSVLDNAAWHALAGPHAGFAEGGASAKRYDPDVSVFAATPDNSAESWEQLGELVGPGGVAVLFRADPVVAPEPWTVLQSGIGHQMVLDREIPDLELPDGFRTLTPEDIPEMIALVELTQPGPFRPRTFELGGYVGIVEADRLVAMAGRRVSPPGHAEISAVCTHPDARGKGYAGLITLAVAQGILNEGGSPFLHVASTNANARRVYERIGFVLRRDVTFTVLRTSS